MNNEQEVHMAPVQRTELAVRVTSRGVHVSLFLLWTPVRWRPCQ